LIIWFARELSILAVTGTSSSRLPKVSSIMGSTWIIKLINLTSHFFIFWVSLRKQLWYQMSFKIKNRLMTLVKMCPSLLTWRLSMLLIVKFNRLNSYELIVMKNYYVLCVIMILIFRLRLKLRLWWLSRIFVLLEFKRKTFLKMFWLESFLTISKPMSMDQLLRAISLLTAIYSNK
jgi:hypothetical protein